MHRGPESSADPADTLPAFQGLRGPGPLRSFFRAFRPRALACLQVETTSHCAGRCVYCPHTVRAEAWKSRHMAPETFAALWPLMLRAGRVHLQGWGEPLLHPNFLDFAALARRAGCRVSTTTSGLRMDQALAEQLVAGGLDIVAFSLTGADAAGNAARQGIPFERVDAAARLLRDARRRLGSPFPKIHIAYLLLASQPESLRGLARLMDDWDADAAVVSTLDLVPAPHLAAEAFRPGERDRIARAQAVADEVGATVRAAGRDFHAVLPRENPAPGCRERPDRTLYCDAEGVISPCVLLNIPVTASADDPADDPVAHRLTFGSVRQEDPLAIWNKPEYRAFREALLRGRPPAVCEACLKRREYLSEEENRSEIE